ncbi:hypothetical protein BDD21_0048 [Thiocapsa rosea]|uniref:Uncharacterized protein n=1 Tax=Thiocapsa rosea TaxID=69360 RepID=A0A495V2G3_9GAMM|nr:hypothetical protein BDD21_0048 [Thiocapsa rosea]
MTTLIDKGLEKGFIAFDAEQKNITYIIQNKRLRFNDSEEKVRANGPSWPRTLRSWKSMASSILIVVLRFMICVSIRP